MRISGCFFFSSRRRHTRWPRDWSSDVCSSDLEAGELAAAGAVLAIPIGATEQHGPHLPLSTDTDIAVVLCRRLASARPDVLLAPVVPYGSSGEHDGFAGTLSIGQPAIQLLVLELARSTTNSSHNLL